MSFLKYKNNKGFTLIELLVVIAIIGLLATLAVVALGNARQKSRDAKRVSDIKQIQTALELRYVEVEGYPTETVDGGTTACAGAMCSLGTEVTCIDNGGLDTSCSAPIYMGLIPADPSSTGTLCTAGGDAAGCDYAYNRVDANNYQIFFYLEGATGGLALGDHCATQNGIADSDTCP